MPLRDDMQLVSVDDHLIEHPRVWLDRLPSKYREAGPRIIETTEEMRTYVGTPVSAGQQAWRFEGRIYPSIGINAVAGRPPSEFSIEPTRFEDMIPGCYDPVSRVKDMDLDGVEASLCFPSFPRFAGTIFLEAQDKELARLCVQAWNDFVLDEWCATAPSRLIPMVILPLWDVAQAVQEIERVVPRGARAIAFPENPVPLGCPSFHTDHWDPVFAAAAAAGTPLCMHFGTSGKIPTTAPDAPLGVSIALMSCNSMFTTVDLLFSAVFERHSQLKVCLSEGGVGWIPHILERADTTWERHRHYQDFGSQHPPSELFRRHIWGCFISDDTGVAHRHEIGVERMMWECDYPHSDSNWPNSRKVLSEMLKDVPDEEAHQIAELNARTLFNFPRLKDS